MGTNGVGKTSFLKALAGTHPRSGGTVMMDGQQVGRAQPQDMARRGLAVVPQGRMIFPLLSVRENMETAFAVLPKADHRIPDEVYDVIAEAFKERIRNVGDASRDSAWDVNVLRLLPNMPRAKYAEKFRPIGVIPLMAKLYSMVCQRLGRP